MPAGLSRYGRLWQIKYHRIHNHVRKLLREKKQEVPRKYNKAKFIVVPVEGGYKWRLMSRGEIVAESTRTFRHQHMAKRSIDTFRNHAVDAPITDD